MVSSEAGKMAALLRWIEPLAPGGIRRRRRLFDWLLGYGLAAIFGLAAAEEAGPTRMLAFGSGTSLTIPAQTWQYGLWLLVTVVVGAFGVWIMSYGGRAEITVREDGIWQQLGRAGGYFFAFAHMEQCRIEQAADGDYWRLDIVMKPQRPQDWSKLTLTAPKKIDAKRIREILASAGVPVTGPDCR
jgi:hypothetical protein